MTINIVYKKTSELIPYINNPRLNDGAVDKVASSIKNFGFKVPIVIDSSNEIIAGHTRIKASLKLGIEEVPCIVADDLNESQIKAFRIADNKTSELAEWDFELLNLELEELELDFDMAEFGFDKEELDDIMGIDKEAEEDDFEAEEDDFEAEPPENPISKRGDIWLLGKHRLMCGDSTTDDVDKLMDGNKADMVFTDPPYGYEYQSNMRTKSEKFEVLKNDDKILDFMPKIKEFVKGFVFICASWKNIDEWIPLFKEHFDFSNMIIWDKGGGGIGDLKKTFLTDYEVILTSHNNAEITGKRIGSVWSIKKDSASNYIHATQKPVELSALAMKHTTLSNSIVLDVFGGSGSTLIACEQLNRVCYMMELDEKYVDVIVNRYIAFKEDDSNVYLIRDGIKIPYSEVEKND